MLTGGYWKWKRMRRFRKKNKTSDRSGLQCLLWSRKKIRSPVKLIHSLQQNHTENFRSEGLKSNKLTSNSLVRFGSRSQFFFLPFFACFTCMFKSFKIRVKQTANLPEINWPDLLGHTKTALTRGKKGRRLIAHATKNRKFAFFF